MLFLVPAVKAQSPSIKDTLELFQIGPLLKSMPSLDSLRATKNDSAKIDLPQAINAKKEEFPMNASGFFFRGMSLGQYGNNSLNGGLRLQIAGKISDNTQIMGVITDESLPIQPEGSTADLNELDRVFINVLNPQFSLKAGDIETGENNNSLNLYNRKIIGLESDIQINKGSIKSIFGQSKGTFHRLEIKGQDGNQGPYYLKSKEGRANVVIIAGSERVWLNGKALKRGDDLDYIIDYSRGELIFMPNNLIFFDSDIDIEYQYQELNYSSNYFETGIKKQSTTNSQFEIKYVTENQNINTSFISDDQKKAFKTTDQIMIEGSYLDSLGEYILVDSIFHYSPGNDSDTKRFSVVFSPSPSGEYIRKISPQERIYYDYIGNEPFEGTKYSPGQSIAAPKGHSVLQVDSNYKFGDNSFLKIESIFSQNRTNLYKRSNPSKHGSAVNIRFNKDKVTLGDIDFTFDLSHKMNSQNYQSLGRDRRVDFNETWDYEVKNSNKLSISKFGTKIKTSSTNIDFDLYNMNTDLEKRSRFQTSIDHKSKYIKNGSLTINRIKHKNFFNQVSSHIAFLNRTINPFIGIKHEMREKDYKFNDFTYGVSLLSKNQFMSIGFGERIDWIFNVENSELIEDKNFRFVQFDYRSTSSSSWNREFMFRSKNPKSVSKDSLSFESAKIAVNYFNSKSPLRFDFILNAQSSITEFRSLVYDSLGAGRGIFRYDPILNEYIRDENGAFVANNILLGSLEKSFNATSISRAIINFKKSKYKKLHHIKYRLSINGDYIGSDKDPVRSIVNRSAKTFRFKHRNEIIIDRARRSIRSRFWLESNINFNGMDLRGWTDKRSKTYVMENQIPIKKDYFIVYDLNFHSFLTKTNKNLQFSRNTEGIYHEFGIKRSLSKKIQLTVKTVYYRDETLFDITSKSVNAYGLKADAVKFFGDNGRIDCSVDYFSANGYPGMPPEALKGISINETFRASFAASAMLDRSMSINLSLSFINDDRYKNFLQMNGELRAYF